MGCASRGYSIVRTARRARRLPVLPAGALTASTTTSARLAWPAAGVADAGCPVHAFEARPDVLVRQVMHRFPDPAQLVFPKASCVTRHGRVGDCFDLIECSARSTGQRQGRQMTGVVSHGDQWQWPAASPNLAAINPFEGSATGIGNRSITRIPRRRSCARSGNLKY